MANLITIAEFQRRFAVSRSTVYRLAQKGHLPLVRLGRGVRIRQSDIDKWYASLPETVGSRWGFF